MGGLWRDVGYSITLDHEGNILTTGIFQRTTDFDPGHGVFSIASAGRSDIFVSKLERTDQLPDESEW